MFGSDIRKEGGRMSKPKSVKMIGIVVDKSFMDAMPDTCYIKKPIPIKAIQISYPFWVSTLEGNHQGKAGDYLLQGIQGELYVCDKNIFEKSYEVSPC
jgi:hypothetical protein